MSLQIDADDGPLLVSVKETINDFRSEFAKMQKEHRYHMRQMLKLAQPTYAPQYGSVTLNSSGQGLIDFGGPMMGRRWVVRMVTFSDGNSFWTSMGSIQATLCTGVPLPSTIPGGAITPNMVRWPFSSGPNSATFSADQMWIVPRDHVMLNFTGGNNGENVLATIWIQDFAETIGSVVEGL